VSVQLDVSADKTISEETSHSSSGVEIGTARRKIMLIIELRTSLGFLGLHFGIGLAHCGKAV
jgi:hypothetical protein